MYLILALPEVIGIARKEIQKHVRLGSSKSDQLLTYDTTFQMLDGFVSTLVMKCTKFSNNPSFPVALLVHEKKDFLYHRRFSDFFVERLGISEGDDIPIATDREAAFKRAIALHPGLMHIFCINHLLKDIEYWCKDNGGKQDDIKVSSNYSETFFPL